MKNIINKYGIKAKKNLGQNFLVDKNIIEKIVECAKIDSETNVIEIGPGYGAVTNLVAKVAKKTICYELDKDMCTILRNELFDYKNLEIINEDFLKVDLEEDIKKYFDSSRLIVISNLPYYITTPIIFKLLEKDYGFDSLYFMMQKEVGDRLTGKPKTKDYNALSVLMNYKTISETLFFVPRNSFSPVPNVDSSFVLMKYQKVDCGVKNEPNFLKFIGKIFLMKRKTLINNLLSSYSFKREEIEEKLTSLGFLKTVRSEELTLEDIALIYKTFFEVAN